MLTEEELRDLDKAVEREAVEYKPGDLVVFCGAMYASNGPNAIQLDNLLTGEFHRLQNKVLTVMRVSDFDASKRSHSVFRNWYSVAEQENLSNQDRWIELHGCEMIKVQGLKLEEDLL